jgi:hypothetical protein
VVDSFLMVTVMVGRTSSDDVRRSRIGIEPS